MPGTDKYKESVVLTLREKYLMLLLFLRLLVAFKVY
jgi:hypothetical protein